MRRGVGVAAVKNKQRAEAAAAGVADQMAATQIAHVEEQLGVFRRSLEDFARLHKAEINKDPEFRAQFQRMTAAVGVDPLASNKGFWGSILGVGDFYYELAVQIVDICLATRPVNGGLIDLDTLKTALVRMRGRNAVAISDDDINRAIKKLEILGGGYRIVQAGSHSLLLSVPRELNVDQTTVLTAAQASGYVTESSLRTAYSWPKDRIDTALRALLQDGMVWVDTQGAETQYWVPSAVAGLS